MREYKTDILIVGGGLVGLSLAKGLEDLNISYLLLDEHLTKPHGQIRPLALSRSSAAILSYLGIWQAVKADCTTISKIHISCAGAFGQLVFGEDNDTKIGMVADLMALQATLKNNLKQPEMLIKGRFLDFVNPLHPHVIKAQVDNNEIQISANWIIAADGLMSQVRVACQLPLELRKEQIAYLGRIKLKNPHQGLAYERFTDWGPLALLPWKSHEMAMVWSCLDTHDIAEIPQALKRQLGSRIGRFEWVSAINLYPLKQSFMPKQLFKNILFLGNAAHSLHPVAGQGFNLSLRDVVVLLDLIKMQGMSQASLAAYLLAREDDQRLIQKATSFLADQFAFIPKFVKGMGLCAMAEFGSLREVFESYAQGLHYDLPEEIYASLEVLND